MSKRNKITPGLTLKELEQRYSKKATPKVAPNSAAKINDPWQEEEKIGLGSPRGSSAPSQDLKFSQGPIFASHNKSRSKSRLLIGAGIASVLLSIFAGYTYITYRHSYLQAERASRRIKLLMTKQKYQECVQQAQTFPQDYSQFHAEVEEMLQYCHSAQAEKQAEKAERQQAEKAERNLDEARKLAGESRFKDAIALAAKVPASSEFHSEARQLMSQWSEEIIQIARHKYQEGNLEEAIAIAGAVPPDTPLAKQAQATIQQWDEEWMQNQTHVQVAQKALDEHRWQDAIDAAKKISNTAYWQKQSLPIIQKAETEIASAQAAASRTTQKPSSRSIPHRRSVRRSSSIRRSKPLPHSRPTSSHSISTSPHSKPTSSHSKPTSSHSRPTSSHSISTPAHSSSTSSHSSSTSSSSSSNEWTCLNNPSPRCR